MTQSNGTGDAAAGRYAVRDFEAYDTHSASPQPSNLLIGRLRLRYMLETDDRSGFFCIGLARVTEVTSDRRVTLDDRWVTPCITSSASPPLVGLIAELTGMLNQRGEALAARLTAPAGRGVSDVADFLLLQSINRWQKLLAHWADCAANSSGRPVCHAGADGGRVRHVHRNDAAAEKLPIIPARGPAAQLCAGGRRFAAVVVRGDRAERGCHSAAGTAARRPGRTD